MPPHGPQLSEEQLQFCLRTLDKAKKAGVEVQHLHTPLGHSVIWRLPNGKEVSGTVQSTKENALFNACKELLPHIYQFV